MSNNLNIQPSIPSAEPFRVEQKHPKIQAVICSRCRSKAIAYIPPNFDSSTGPYFKCISKTCGYSDIYYKFLRKDGNTPLGSTDPSDLLRPASFGVVRTRRTQPKDRHTLNRGRNATKEEIPKLGNMVDSDLHSLLKDRIGIITAITDEIPGEDQ
jgi:hypothetical protein